MNVHMYRNCPSKRPCPCKHSPPIFDDSMVHVYIRYTYKWLLRVSTHLTREVQALMGYAQENTVLFFATQTISGIHGPLAKEFGL